MKIDLNDIEAGTYEVVALRWDQILSKPGEPLDFRRHRRGDRVELDIEDARRLVVAGAVKKPGDKGPEQTLDGPSTPPGRSAPSSDPKLEDTVKPPVNEAPTRHSVADVKAYVGDDLDKAAAILALEQADTKPRPTLVKWLEELLTTPTAPAASGDSTAGDQGDADPGSGQS